MTSFPKTQRNPLTRPVDILSPDKTTVHGTFLLQNEDRDNRKCALITLQYLNRQLSASNAGYFHALMDIRLELEKEGILLKCYGASRNVWPSGMGLSMGGSKAYKQFLGKQCDIRDLVSVFDSGSDIDPCTVEEQRQFHKEWLLSIGIDPNKEVYPWKVLFASQPFKTAVLFFSKNILKRGRKPENTKA